MRVFDALPEARLEFLGNVEAQLAPAHALLDAPFGGRLIVDVTAARVEGPRLKASLAGTAAADWVTVSADGGSGALDVRATLKTDDGALIFSEYRGRVQFDPGGVHPVFVSPRYETGDARYAWLNGLQCIGKGISNARERWLRYRLYAVV
ncbi:DUF3237 domain-containing protein [Novosphingobium sp. Gsoil 351]|uniref:DUF3237 domain-containing protein n=1 Tax=Novosphingobium sp. Gsoil 351 TaxID=2675225 RepID=UPI0012B4E0CD|nr:DUF3237 domain-containing protein [Novosphingobium sp. Gsoil 351]QGN55690.1 DUF3237 family protein [Novosphingobium sp. Gsoil 351]